MDELHNVANIEKFHGGGGTDMRKAYDNMDKHNITPQAVVVITDGDTPFPTECKYPTLWAITEERTVSPIGSTIHVKI